MSHLPERGERGCAIAPTIKKVGTIEKYKPNPKEPATAVKHPVTTASHRILPETIMFVRYSDSLIPKMSPSAVLTLFRYALIRKRTHIPTVIARQEQFGSGGPITLCCKCEKCLRTLTRNNWGCATSHAF